MPNITNITPTLSIDVVDAFFALHGWEVEHAGTGYGDGPRAFYCVRSSTGRKFFTREDALYSLLCTLTHQEA